MQDCSKSMLQSAERAQMNQNQDQTPTKPAVPAQDKPASAPVAHAPSQNQGQGKPEAPVAAPATKA
jgi:hypothetical protein